MLAALYNKTFEAGVYSKPGSWPHGLSVEKSKQRCSLSMEPRILIRWKPWQVVLLFAGLQCGLTAVGVYFFDYFAGTATVGFARMGAVHGTGMFFVYMLGAINAVVVLVPVFHLRFIGAGALVYLGWALIGVPVEYYYEWLINTSLKGPWAVMVWCAMGPLAGLSADLAYRFLPRSLTPAWRAALTGAVLGFAGYLTTLAALSFLYTVPLSVEPGSFAGLTYFGLPWLLGHSALGGVVAGVLVAGGPRRT
jgi:hypothetical protein